MERTRLELNIMIFRASIRGSYYVLKVVSRLYSLTRTDFIVLIKSTVVDF